MKNTGKKQNDESKGLNEELFDFLATFDTAGTPSAARKHADSGGTWNEVYTPNQGNDKVFLHDSNGWMLMVRPTHASTENDVMYHVIMEDTRDGAHNGKYKLMGQAEFASTFACNFINALPTSAATAKIMELADEITAHVPEMKKLKIKTLADRQESSVYIGRIILNFLMRKNRQR